MSQIASLANAFREDFPIGVAVSPQTLETHMQLILRHFVSLTATNAMKPEATQPEEGRFTFERGDRIADFARLYGMALRGHTLVWHNQTPPWFFEENGEPVKRATALRRMERHIKMLMGHYKNLVHTWDVVNEAVNDHDDGAILRDSPWLRAVGEDYLFHAFRAAKDTNIDCKLCYNDYNEAGERKSKRIYEMVKELRAEGAKVDVIGLQGHYNCYGPPMDRLREAIELYASLGVRLQVTELDVSLFRFEDGSHLPAPPAELLERQADYYAALFRLFREYRRVIDSVTFWGEADDVTWLSHFPVRNRKNWPLLFDDDQLPKPAYHKLIEVAAE